MGGHEEIEQGNQRLIDSSEDGLFLDALEAVISNIFTNNGAIFLFDETVVVFFMVPASGKRDAVVFTPGFCVVVDEFRAIIAVKLQDWKKDRGIDIGQSIESPLLSIIEERTQFYPT